MSNSDTRIYLVGFMGSGKTTVGRLLARRLGWSFVDLDAEIERTEGRPIAEIFRSSGEGYFRRLESKCLRALTREARQVVALGGGAYADAANRAYVEASGLSVYLETGLEAIRDRVGADRARPLYSGPEQVDKLYRERRPLYRMAQVRIETDGLSPEQVVDRLLASIDSSC